MLLVCKRFYTALSNPRDRVAGYLRQLQANWLYYKARGIIGMSIWKKWERSGPDKQHKWRHASTVDIVALPGGYQSSSFSERDAFFSFREKRGCLRITVPDQVVESTYYFCTQCENVHTVGHVCRQMQRKKCAWSTKKSLWCADCLLPVVTTREEMWIHTRKCRNEPIHCHGCGLDEPRWKFQRGQHCLRPCWFVSADDTAEKIKLV